MNKDISAQVSDNLPTGRQAMMPQSLKAGNKTNFNNAASQ
jgi:hypothetical protein